MGWISCLFWNKMVAKSAYYWLNCSGLWLLQQPVDGCTHLTTLPLGLNTPVHCSLFILCSDLTCGRRTSVSTDTPEEAGGLYHHFFQTTSFSHTRRLLQWIHVLQLARCRWYMYDSFFFNHISPWSLQTKSKSWKLVGCTISPCIVPLSSHKCNRNTTTED